MLILPGAVRPWSEGMNPNATRVELGEPPPHLIPHCWKCRVPVERFTIDYLRSPHYVPVQYTCHGVTSGMKIPTAQVLHAGKTGEALWVFTETTTNGRHRVR